MRRFMNILIWFGLVFFILVFSTGCTANQAPTDCVSSQVSTGPAPTSKSTLAASTTASVLPKSGSVSNTLGTNLLITPFYYNLHDPRADGYVYFQDMGVITWYGVSSFQEDGYKYEGLRLVFENRSQSLFLDDTPIPTKGAVVETQEGLTYPAFFFGGQASWGSPIQPLGHILGTGTPLPPGFRTLGMGDYFDDMYGTPFDLKNYGATYPGITVIFRVPNAAHATQLRIPSIPYPIDLASASSSAPQIPTDIPPDRFASLNTMSGQQLVNQSGGITVTSLGQCVNWDLGDANERFGGFSYKVVNLDKFSDHSAVIPLPTVVAYFVDGRIQISGPANLKDAISYDSAKIHNVSAPDNNHLEFSIGPGLDDTVTIPYYDWNNGLKPIFLMVVPPGTTIRQNIATPPIYWTDADYSKTPNAGTALSTKLHNGGSWAETQVGSQNSDWINASGTNCELFVENAFGTSGKYQDAYTAFQQIGSSGLPQSYGQIVYFDRNQGNGMHGHAGIYIGFGQMVCVTSSGVKQESITLWGQNEATYLGYANPPESWPGR